MTSYIVIVVVVVVGSQVIHQGHLFKRGRLMPTWKERYFRLTQYALSYSENKDDPTSLGVIPISMIRGISRKDGMQFRGGMGLLLTTVGRVYAISSDTRSEIDAWVAWREYLRFFFFCKKQNHLCHYELKQMVSSFVEANSRPLWNFTSQLQRA
jgi:hypothetical protein